METDQRIVGRSKKVSADGQSVVVNQPVPLNGGPIYERGTERDGHEPPVSEDSHVPPTQRLDGQVNRQTAGEQTNCVKDRDAENILRHRPGEAFAYIKEVRHNKDRENRGLGGD